MIYIISPHLDDAAFSCYNALIADEEVKVINVFTHADDAMSLTGWDYLTGSKSPVERMQERLEEDSAVMARVNRDALDLNLNRKQIFLNALRDRILENIPDPKRVLIPAGIGLHPAHTMCRDALLATDLPISLYADIPYAFQYGWPGKITGKDEPQNLHPYKLWEHEMQSRYRKNGLGDMRIVKFTPEQTQEKIELLKLYKSQWPALLASSGNRLEDPKVMQYEVRWRLGLAASI